MSIIVLCSATGAPGVTTCALGLTLTWPGDVLLADCDRDAGQAVLAGYLQGHDAVGCGLLEVARLHREGHQIGAADVLQRTVALGDEPPRRRFLPGFTRPASAAMFAPVWGSLAEAFTEVSAAGAGVIVDAGRIGPHGLSNELIRVADRVLLVARTSLRSLAATRLQLPHLLDQVENSTGATRSGLLLVGNGHPYRAGEITRQFGQPVVGVVDIDASAATVLSEGATPRRRFDRSILLRSCADLAATLAVTDVLADAADVTDVLEEAG